MQLFFMPIHKERELPPHGIAADHLNVLSVRITHLMFSYSKKLGVTYQNNNKELLVHLLSSSWIAQLAMQLAIQSRCS